MTARFHQIIVLLLLVAAISHAAEPPAGTVIVHPVDGAEMVWVPGGAFVMGLDEADGDQVARDLGFAGYADLWAWDAFPKRSVQVEGFFIDRTEVTVERWRRFAAARPEEAAGVPAFNVSQAPDDQQRAAGAITWAHAQRYANWSGKLLPSDAQWEKAARGSDGRLYPWGNDKPDATRLLLERPAKAPLLPAIVGQHPAGASPYGVLDMVGGQYEWASNWLEPYPNNHEAQRMIDYCGHRAATLRGGSTYHGRISYYASKRMGMAPEETHFHIGFRTVWQPPEGYFESEAYRAAAKQAGDSHRQALPDAASQ